MKENLKSGAELILEERKRQIEVEGYDEEHDKNHDVNIFILAALAYAVYDDNPDQAFYMWPWEEKYFKPTTLRRNLIKAGALLAAGIDKLQKDEEK